MSSCRSPNCLCRPLRHCIRQPLCACHCPIVCVSPTPLCGLRQPCPIVLVGGKFLLLFQCIGRFYFLLCILCERINNFWNLYVLFSYILKQCNNTHVQATVGSCPSSFHFPPFTSLAIGASSVASMLGRVKGLKATGADSRGTSRVMKDQLESFDHSFVLQSIVTHSPSIDRGRPLDPNHNKIFMK